MIQLSCPYMTVGKTIALTIQTYVSKVMSLLFNTLSMFVIAFLPRSKRLLISWLQSPSAVILEPNRMKSVTASTFSPSICHGVIRPCHEVIRNISPLYCRYCRYFLFCQSLLTLFLVLFLLPYKKFSM